MGSKPCNRVRELRELLGRMTQQTLAEKVGVSRQTIIAIESGRYS
ncbi:MAG: helix-turn-helix domain-containing protein, partial [Wenzhouxiangella sp.]|nr:helix-turn-helix domain-containing protein [Wenzhouxiangella sp.]